MTRLLYQTQALPIAVHLRLRYSEKMCPRTVIVGRFPDDQDPSGTAQPVRRCPREYYGDMQRKVLKLPPTEATDELLSLC